MKKLLFSFLLLFLVIGFADAAYEKYFDTQSQCVQYQLNYQSLMTAKGYTCLCELPNILSTKYQYTCSEGTPTDSFLSCEIKLALYFPYCSDSNTRAEYYCSSGGLILTKFIDCPSSEVCVKYPTLKKTACEPSNVREVDAPFDAGSRSYCWNPIERVCDYTSVCLTQSFSTLRSCTTYGSSQNLDEIVEKPSIIDNAVDSVVGSVKGFFFELGIYLLGIILIIIGLFVKKYRVFFIVAGVCIILLNFTGLVPGVQTVYRVLTATEVSSGADYWCGTTISQCTPGTGSGLDDTRCQIKKAFGDYSQCVVSYTFNGAAYNTGAQATIDGDLCSVRQIADPEYVDAGADVCFVKGSLNAVSTFNSVFNSALVVEPSTPPVEQPTTPTEWLNLNSWFSPKKPSSAPSQSSGTLASSIVNAITEFFSFRWLGL